MLAFSAVNSEEDICKDVNVEEGVTPCKCKSGYVWNGKRCQPVNRITFGPQQKGTCPEGTNIIQSFEQCKDALRDMEVFHGEYLFRDVTHDDGESVNEIYGGTDFAHGCFMINMKGYFSAPYFNVHTNKEKPADTLHPVTQLCAYKCSDDKDTESFCKTKSRDSICNDDRYKHWCSMTCGKCKVLDVNPEKLVPWV